MGLPTHSGRRATLGVSLAAALLVFGGCSEGERLFVPADGGGPVVDSVAVSPATARLTQVGQTQAFTATPLDAEGNALQVDVTWASEDIAVVTLDQTGVATARGPGQTDVTASAGDATGRSVITVGPIAEP